MYTFFFGVYPYICLSVFTLGLIARYVATPGEWNARSSNLFAKKSLAVGSCLFHYAIILAFFGHLFGLLIPAYAMNAVGFSQSAHLALAKFAGKIIAGCVFVGLAILLFRRIDSRNVWATTVPMDIVVILFILFQALTGGYQDYFGHQDALAIAGPWLRDLLCFQPHPAIMSYAPVSIQMHVVSGFAIFAMIPFSRLVHFFSIPLTWFVRPLISYRRRYENL